MPSPPPPPPLYAFFFYGTGLFYVFYLFAFKLPLFSIIIFISLEKSLLFPTGKFTVENFPYLYHLNFVAAVLLETAKFEFATTIVF